MYIIKSIVSIKKQAKQIFRNQKTIIPIAFLAMFCTLIVVEGTHAQQQGDPNFKPAVEEPAFSKGEGPLVLVDEAHHNFHTVDGRYRPFARLLRRDGYKVKALESSITLDALKSVDILVISNALAKCNVDNWKLPTPSAFTDQEIQILQTWVQKGGSLLLIADHMPFPGAVEDLALSFGIIMGNGFAFTADSSGIMQFRKTNGLLRQHSITEGRNSSEIVDSVTTFTGQAFRIQSDVAAEPLMVMGKNTILLLPTEAWEFSKQTPRIRATGMLQAATLQVGEGRIAVFGEAAMFTAQLAGSQQRPMGMNHPKASQNAQFLLNVIHWLSGLLS
jgi:hypothetical protein